MAGGWVLYHRGYERGAGHPLAWHDLTARLGRAEFPHPVGQLFRSRGDLAEVLRASMPGRAPAPPPIDFRRREAVLIAAGPRSATGYELRVVGIREDRGRIVVTVRERAPGLGDPVRAEVTYPYRLITIRRSDKPVGLHWLGRP